VSRSVRALGLVIAVLLGAFLGRLLTHSRGLVFEVPVPLDVQVWHIISPGLEAGMQYPGRGSHLSTDALVITDHLFYGADRLVPRLSGQASSVELELAPDSATLEILLGQPQGGMVRLHPDTHGTQAVLHIQDGVLMLETDAGGRAIGPSDPDRLELSALGGSARIHKVVIRDADGEVLMAEDYRGGGLQGPVLPVGTLLGGLMGLLLGLLLPGRGLVRGGALTVLLLLGPALVLLAPPDAWLGWLERLYLVEAAPSGLARAALGISCLPLLVAGLARAVSGLWSYRSSAPRALVLVWSLCAVAALGVHWEGSPWMLGALGWALAPLWLAHKDQEGSRTWLGLDLLSFALVLCLGWADGLWIATLWRVAVLVGGAHILADRAPGPAMNTLFLLVLAMVPATEIAARGSALDRTWDPTQLSEERSSERGWRDPIESWTGRCGPMGGSRRSLLVAGGSSAGGAYQHTDDPDASFVVQTHNQLCADLPPGLALRTYNYARGNRDTFTISRTIQTMLDKTGADVVLLYVGVNDLLADHHSMTRKQREAQRMERSAALRGVAGMARRLRLVTGFWLATRALPDANAPAVSDVPLPDAVENFGLIADAAAAAGARLVLMTEHMRAKQAGRLDAYRQAQIALAASREGVDFLDVRPAFEGASDDQILVDQNHLTREGGERLGRRLAAAVGPLLWAQGSSR
jgi:lysophospholipase L1-like esterase